MGCIYCVVVFSWIFCEILISLLFLILAVLESEFIYSQFMTELKSFEEMLFLTSHKRQLISVLKGCFSF